MARRPRLFVPGLSQHVIQRGNNRTAIFRALSDYRLFSELLLSAASKCEVAIHGYVLMTTHIHLLATPFSKSSLPRMMQKIGRNYVPAFNGRYGRTGTLWEGRYRASLIEDEKYWLTCLRYIELNPVRAGIVPRPELYDWSSYRAHAFGRTDSLLTPHALFLTSGPTAEGRQLSWQAMCGVPVEDEMLIAIRHAVHTCRPLKDGLEEIEPTQTTEKVPA